MMRIKPVKTPVAQRFLDYGSNFFQQFSVPLLLF